MVWTFWIWNKACLTYMFCCQIVSARRNFTFPDGVGFWLKKTFGHKHTRLFGARAELIVPPPGRTHSKVTKCWATLTTLTIWPVIGINYSQMIFDQSSTSYSSEWETAELFVCLFFSFWRRAKYCFKKIARLTQALG